MHLLEFTVAGAVMAGFVVSAALPLCLFIVARVPVLAGHNAIQFLVSVLVVIITWASALLFVPAARPAGVGEIAVGAIVIGSAILVYLEIWGLLSRGYTLGLLITIHQAGQPLPAVELARRYRRGEGLEWIMRHRLAGLEAAGLVRHDGENLVLTPRLGSAVARSYRVLITLLGLKVTG